MNKRLQALGCMLLLLLCVACTPDFQSPRDLEKVTGDPSISASAMNTILDQAHSPAHGLGTTLYRLSLQYHIDAAFAMAFFHHESAYGLKGVAVQTHSLGNIRCTRGSSCDPTGGYRAYPTWQAGAEDWYQLISQVYIAHGLDTVSRIIPVYAPSSDSNNEAAYIQCIKSDVQSYRSGVGEGGSL